MDTISRNRIVDYVLSEQNAKDINLRHKAGVGGSQANVGTIDNQPGDVLPLLVVKVNPGSIDGQVFTDGNDTLWVQNVKQADPDYGKEDTPTAGAVEYGVWRWPERPKANDEKASTKR